ncbi:MAG: 30S ribosomal protein S17 [Saprospiraceae bacterium]|nr:30S ribosomal protein S17 [Saprospiraceae bacterium]
MAISANKKQIVGVVTSNKMDKSVTVSVERRLKHPMYGKFVKKTKKFMAHDEKNECNEGDIVRIIESRPLSRLKRWNLVEIIEKAK